MLLAILIVHILLTTLADAFLHAVRELTVPLASFFFYGKRKLLDYFQANFTLKNLKGQRVAYYELGITFLGNRWCSNCNSLP